jgi:hypothetical protein
MIKLVKPPGVGKLDVRIANVSNPIFHMYRAVFYPQGSGYHSTADPFVVVSVTPWESRFPYIEYLKTGGYLRKLLLSRRECVVALLAHELRHAWQKKHKGKRGKVHGARGLYSDRDADAYAIRKVREYRRTIGEFKERQALITARGFFNSL